MGGHVFLDGVALGLAFKVSNALGAAVFIAILAHAFSDGLNTVSLLIKSGHWTTRAISLLGLDAVMRISGAALGSYVIISDPTLAIYLATFAGFVIYLATSHILPEAHSRHPSRLTIFSTILGTMIAFAIGRYKFKGRSSSNLLIFLPMATPEIVLGASLLSLFLVFKINPGFWPTVIAHVVFCVSFVVVTVKARIASLDPRLEQAAMDLYANKLETFRRVTLPLVAPGIAGAALLAFSLSFDDFIITNFNSGTLITFPKFVYVSAARGIPAQANVIGSAMFFLALAIVIAAQLVKRKKTR